VTPDPFGTAALRERVLAAWTASPARLREDANAEEDYSLGGYRDRLVVELAQNAADAASQAGGLGRVRFSLSADGMLLAAANTGAPLDGAGVQALATLRASAKRDGSTTGRFGVGFAAVLSVTDEPVLLSRGGSVRFSRADTAQLVAGIPELADEVRRRDGHVPVLRLPFEAEGEPPAGFSTVVVLPMRDDAAADLTRRLLEEIDDALLLALPGLEQVEVEIDGSTRVLSDAASRWVTFERSGELAGPADRSLFADRPVEEAQRPWWRVLWALPRDPAIPVPAVVHAPTPTDEPLAWPALLLATLPLDPSRRHVAPGPLTDRIVGEAATAYADLLSERAAAAVDVLSLVPTGLGAGALDAALRVATLERLKASPILIAADGGRPLRPRDAVTVEGVDGLDVASVLAPYVAGLVDARPGARSALRALGVPSIAVADVVESMPDATGPAAWSERYRALAPLGETPEGREALGVLPVPLADGRVVRGARGLLLPPPSMKAELLHRLAVAGVRLVHPEAAHPLLTRLGALEATPRQLLQDAAVRELVETSPDADEPDEVAATVLELVAAAESDLPVLDWLGDLALPDADGDLAPASALALPGSVAVRVFDPDEIGLVAPELVERWGPGPLVACGVLSGLPVVVADEIDLTDPDLPDLLDLPDVELWVRDCAASGAVTELVAGEFVAVRDLDLIRPDAWAEAVRAIAEQPQTRTALVDPVRVRDSSGRGRDVPSYTSWWLRRELALAARRDPDASGAVRALLDPAPEWVAGLDHEVRRVLGVVHDLEDLTPGATAVVLDRMADPARELGLADLLALWAWLAEASADSSSEVTPPERVRAWDGEGSLIVDASAAAVVDEPKWLQRNDLGPFVIAGQGEALADLLDLDLASERTEGRVTSVGVEESVPRAVAGVLPYAPTTAPSTWWRHQRLEVDGREVGWWIDDDGRIHAQGLEQLAPALAWAAGRWADRFALAAVLRDPAAAATLALDAAFD
jgi:hypothetical protein